jgi:hypothetical protein
MITISELLRIRIKFMRENPYVYVARWVMSAATNEYIKLHLACQCNRPGAPREMHADSCVSSNDGLLSSLFGGEIRIDDAESGIKIESCESSRTTRED